MKLTKSNIAEIEESIYKATAKKEGAVVTGYTLYFGEDFSKCPAPQGQQFIYLPCPLIGLTENAPDVPLSIPPVIALVEWRKANLLDVFKFWANGL